MSVITDTNNINFEVCHCVNVNSAVISQHFSKNHMIISVVAAKIWYLKNVRFLIGHPVYSSVTFSAI